MPLPTKAHIGSKACKIAVHRARLVARKLTPLPVSTAAIVARSGAKWMMAETHLPRGTMEVWTTVDGVAFVAACQKIATFLDRSPVEVAVAVQKHKTSRDLLDIARRLVWRKGTTPPAKLAEVARVFGGVLTWHGTKVFASPNGR